MGEPRRAFHGLEIELQRFSGARGVRVIHPGNQVIAEHRHDWPCITIHVIGSYRERFEHGEVAIGGPAAVLHPAGAWHANAIAPGGLETVSIQFDPDWLPVDARGELATFPRCWTHGTGALAAAKLAASWTSPDIAEARLVQATCDFLAEGLSMEPSPEPRWLKEVTEALAIRPVIDATALAAELGLHPAWLARAFRAARGEGIRQAAGRARVERAVALLRETDMAAAEVAVAAGFCDQSHMIRAFKRLLCRTPSSVRNERHHLEMVPKQAA